MLFIRAKYMNVYLQAHTYILAKDIFHILVALMAYYFILSSN